LAFWLVAGAGGALAAPIHDAAESGDVAKLQQLIDSGVKVDELRKGDSATALDVASYAGKLNAVETLVKDGADIDAHTAAGYTPLHLAALKGHVDVVDFLLKHGAEIDAISADGDTPLHLAAASGNMEVVEHLLDQGADRSIRDFDGRTPYNIAMARGHEAVAKLVQPRESATPSIYRDGTADIEKRIEQMEAAISRYRANSAKEPSLSELGKPDTDAGASPSTAPGNGKALSTEMSTEELLKAAGELINSSRSPETAGPSGIDAAVAKDLSQGTVADLKAPASPKSSLGPDGSDPLFTKADPGETDDPLSAADKSLGLSASSAGGDYAIQLVAVRSKDRAEQEWQRLTNKHPDLLLALNSQVTQADLGDKGTFYRLRAGPLTKDRASAICSSLADAHENCLVVKQ
jgi:cell division septation protein DedD